MGEADPDSGSLQRRERDVLMAFVRPLHPIQVGTPSVPDEDNQRLGALAELVSPVHFLDLVRQALIRCAGQTTWEALGPPETLFDHVVEAEHGSEVRDALVLLKSSLREGLGRSPDEEFVAQEASILLHVTLRQWIQLLDDALLEVAGGRLPLADVSYLPLGRGRMEQYKTEANQTLLNNTAIDSDFVEEPWKALARSLSARLHQGPIDLPLQMRLQLERGTPYICRTP